MTTEVKILHVVNISFVLPYYIGDQFDHFNKRGVKFYVACLPSSHFTEYAHKKGFLPINLNILREISLFADLKAVWQLRKLIRQEKIDIVIGHTPKAAMIAMLAAYFAKVEKRIYFRHGIMFETSGGLKRMILKSIEMMTGKIATKVVCVSNSVMEVSKMERLSDPRKNILLGKGSCNGVDAGMRFNPKNVNHATIDRLKKFYGISPGDKVIGYVGRLVNDKGINELIGAWKILTKGRNNIQLLLVGPMELRDGLSEEVRNFIIHTPTIIYTGQTEDVVPFYGLMDIFILPSSREGLPTVVLEASAMELPVITTRATGCIDSITENVTGIFTDITPIDIAKKIEFYLDEPGLAKQHGSQGRHFILEKFNPVQIWKDIEDKVLEISFETQSQELSTAEKLHKAS